MAIDPYSRHQPTNPRVEARKIQSATDQAKRIAAVKAKNAATAPAPGQLSPDTYALPPAWEGKLTPKLGPQMTQQNPPSNGTSSTEADAFSEPTKPTPPASMRNPLPPGNLAPQTFTQIIPATRTPNPYSYDSGRGTAQQAEEWQARNNGSISSYTYDPRTWTPAIQPGTETDLQSPAIQNELDASAGIQSPSAQQAREIASAQSTGKPTMTPYGPIQVTAPQPQVAATPTTESGAGRIPGTAAAAAQPKPQASPYRVEPTPENQNWKQQLFDQHPEIWKDGSDANKAFVAAFKEHGDPNRALETADLLKQARLGPMTAQQADADLAERTKTSPYTLPEPTPGTGTAPNTEADAFAPPKNWPFPQPPTQRPDIYGPPTPRAADQRKDTLETLDKMIAGGTPEARGAKNEEEFKQSPEGREMTRRPNKKVSDAKRKLNPYG